MEIYICECPTLPAVTQLVELSNRVLTESVVMNMVSGSEEIVINKEYLSKEELKYASLATDEQISFFKDTMKKNGWRRVENESNHFDLPPEILWNKI